MHEAVNGSTDDVVLFAGSGCTGAIKKLVDILGLQPHGRSLVQESEKGELRCPYPGCERHFCETKSFKLHARSHNDGNATFMEAKRLSNADNSSALRKPRPSMIARDALAAAGREAVHDTVVVFVGPMEHHSNLLPWRTLFWGDMHAFPHLNPCPLVTYAVSRAGESGAKVVEISSDKYGRADLQDLEAQLKAHAHFKRKIGSFSAASNLTGIMEQVGHYAFDNSNLI